MKPEEAKTIRNRVTQYFASGAFDEGMRLLSSSDQLPGPVRLECLGNLSFYRRELQEAVRQFEAAIQLDPQYPVSRYQYLVGVQKEKQGDLEAAFVRYQNAIEADPSFVDAYVELGGLLAKVGDFQGAAQCYRDAARLEPDDLSNLYNLKTTLAKLAEEEPERYREELASAELAYEDLERRGARLPSHRKW